MEPGTKDEKSTPTLSEGVECNFGTVADVLEYITANDVNFIDFCFCDPLGQWQHCTYHASRVNKRLLESGIYFDGSSIRLFTSINNSDMIMKPDIETFWIDPFHQYKTLHVICDIYYETNEVYERCPRQIAKKASQVITTSGIGDAIVFGPECEFFVFDRFESNISNGEISVKIDGDEATWKNIKSDYKTNPGCRYPRKKMYFPVPPIDRLSHFRSHALNLLSSVGLEVEKHHHEVGVCQCEIGFEFDTLLSTADNLMTCKYIIKNLAAYYKKTATFMPKPIHNEAGSGCHLHQSVWSIEKDLNLFHDESNSELFQLSETALYYIGGIFKHANSLCALTNPTTNSYKRLVPGFEAPSNLCYGKANRSAAIRIPSAQGAHAKRIECRFPDAACCPYLACAALCLAGVDGILNKIDPPHPCETNAYTDETLDTPKLPSTLSEALDALENDHEYLLYENVFPESWIGDYIALKREEIRDVQSIPHPREYELYFNN